MTGGDETRDERTVGAEAQGDGSGAGPAAIADDGPRPAALEETWTLKARRLASGWRAALIVGAAAGALFAGSPTARDGVAAAGAQVQEAALKRPEHRVRTIVIEGARRVRSGDVVAALALGPEDRSALAFDAHAARDRVETLGWVGRAEVTLRQPGTVLVRLDERVPAALWRRGGRLVLLDARGVAIADVTPAEARAGDWGRLPLLIGDGAGAALAEALDLFHEAESAGLTVAALVRVGGRRWDAALAGGPRALLPHDGAAAALAQVIDWARSADLLRRDLTVVDLRIPHAPTARLAQGPGDVATGTVR